MRIARFSAHDEVRYGVVDNPGQVPGGLANGHNDESQAGGQTPEGLTVAEISGHPFSPGGADVRLTGARYPLDDVRLLAPVLPSKIVAIGKNYADHARETGSEPPSEPLIFLKPSTAVIGPGDPIVRPVHLSNRVDYEGELVLVFGRLCRDVPPERVPEVIFGYTCGNDVTARDLQAADGQWTRAKGFDTFCPLGPWIETAFDPADRLLTTTVNGEIKQQASTSELVHDIVKLVCYVTAVMTMLPGDVLLTGTPAGIGPLAVGDSVSVDIDGIGTLTNPVTDQS
jgi:2-keto-4-pentenoate hydratase/2-oxohepta-3-ene-1,7-dioic acid hydratase in catechol pathway